MHKNILYFCNKLRIEKGDYYCYNLGVKFDKGFAFETNAEPIFRHSKPRRQCRQSLYQNATFCAEDVGLPKSRKTFWEEEYMPVKAKPCRTGMASGKGIVRRGASPQTTIYVNIAQVYNYDKTKAFIKTE